MAPPNGIARRHVHISAGPALLLICLTLSSCPDAALVLKQVKEAQADAIPYTVTYDGNGASGGSVPFDGTDYTRGQTVTVQGNTGGLSRMGYAFAGWNTQADGGGTSYTQGQTFTIGTSSVTLYAIWTKLPTYTVTYDANGATGGSVPVDTTNYLEHYYVTVLGNSGNLANPPYAFAGWNTQADGNGTLYDPGRSFVMGTSNVTLYAVWKPGYSVTYDGNGATAGSVPVDPVLYLPGRLVTVLDNTGGLEKTSCIFKGWNTTADGSGTTYTAGRKFTIGSANVTLYALWVHIYTVSYDGNGATGGSVPADVPTYQGQRVTVSGNTGGLVRTHYAFVGWSLQPDGSGSTYTPGQTFTMGASDVVLYAKWAPAIWNVAGTGTAGYSGDNGPATSAQLKNPAGVAAAADGNLYIADTANNRVRKVSPAGTITTVAGTGTAGYSGDDGPATSANLNGPAAVAVDAGGNLYIADGQRIRKVSPGGTITTVAGTGTSGYSGDDGPATAAKLFNPSGVAVDTAGNLYIADSNNYRVRRVSAGGTITTLAGTGVAGYSGDNGPAASAQINYPVGVAVDADGNLFIAEMYNNVIRRVSVAGTITTVAGTGAAGYSGDGGPATLAQLNNPAGVAVDAAGNIFVGDLKNYRVRKVLTGGTISTIAGTGIPGNTGDNGPAASAPMGYPYGVAADPLGNLYFVDLWYCRVREVSPP